MTREEAFRILSNGLLDAPSEHEWCMAFEMAIEALEQKPCEDCISREEALMALTGDITDCTVEEYIVRLRGKLSKLPPVTPKEKTGHWITQWNVAHQKEYYYCSECREEFSYDGETGIKMNDYDFCPNCGAKMVEP